MVNQYSMNMPNNVGYAKNAQDYTNQKTQSNRSTNLLAPVIGTTVAGSVVGSAIGAFRKKSPIDSSGEISDEFTKKVYKKYINKRATDDMKKRIKSFEKFIKNIDKAKNAESLKKLLNENLSLIPLYNPKIKKNSYINSINSNNFQDYKKMLKAFLGYDLNNLFIEFKLLLLSCWDSTSKKFIKNDKIDDDMFKIIKNTSAGNKWKSGLKYGAISGLILGSLIAGYNYIMNKKNS